MYPLTTAFSILPEVLANSKRRENKIIQIVKEKIKLSLLIIKYVENPKELTKKKIHLKLISDYCKDARYKVNIQNTITFLFLVMNK